MTGPSVAPSTYERRYSRVQLPVAAQVSCASLDLFHEPAHLRDVSAGGAFFYSDIDLEPGTTLRIEFAVTVIGSQVQITCEGSVVRVEPNALGEKTGIAMQFASLHLS